MGDAYRPATMRVRMLTTSVLPLAMACVDQSGMQPIGNPTNDPTSTTTTTSGVMWRSDSNDKERNDERLLREEAETAERQQRWATERAERAKDAGPDAR